MVGRARRKETMDSMTSHFDPAPLPSAGGFFDADADQPSAICWSAPPQVPAKQAQRFSWRLRRALRGHLDDGTCACIPAYTGGTGRPVAVDGKLRTPACFGSRGEPWAYPLGCGRMCEPDYEATIVVIDPSPRRGFSILAELYT